jgi:hypothetical protein
VVAHFGPAREFLSDPYLQFDVISNKSNHISNKHHMSDSWLSRGIGDHAGDHVAVTGRSSLPPRGHRITIMQLQAHAVQVRETSFADEIPSGISLPMFYR